MYVWFNKLPDQARGAVYAAIIISFSSFVTVLLTFIVKDYLIPIWLENRKRKKENSNAFLKYETPLLQALISLNYRLEEIFTDRSFFLLPEAPPTEFYKYKFISTLYRLAAVIGWIRAIQMETINLVAPSKNRYRRIDDAIQGFCKSLADGQHIEVALVKNLCKTWDISILKIEAGVLRELGSEIDNLIQQYNFDNKQETATDLIVNEQRRLLQNIKEKIADRLNIDKAIDTGNTFDIAMKEISIKQALIYRDWQQAIGDLMIEKIEKSIRSYDVIGFNKFESLCYNGSIEEKKWIKRIECLFSGIDIVTTIEQFDSRIEQLKQIKKAAGELAKAFSLENTNKSIFKISFSLSKNFPFVQRIETRQGFK